MKENDPIKLIKAMAENIGKALEVDAVRVFAIDLEKGTGIVEAFWVRKKSTKLEKAPNKITAEKYEDIIGEIWKSRKPIMSYSDDINPALSATGSAMVIHGDYKIKTFLCYPFGFHEKGFSMLTLAVVDEVRRWTDEELRLIDSFINELSLALMKAEMLRKQGEEKQALEKNYDKVEKMLEGMVNALAMASEQKDPFTAGHQRRVVKLAVALAQEMKLPEDQVEGIRIAATVHDIGKIYVPAETLCKPAELSDLEFGIVQAHSQLGFDILKTVEFPWPVAKIVIQHHEMMDGSGYPLKLKGDEICLEARILAVADAVEAMLGQRPYRKPFSVDAMLKELKKWRGKKYDAAVVDACVKLFKTDKFKFE